MRVDEAISRCRRDMAFTLVLKAALWGAGILAVASAVVMNLNGAIMLGSLAAVWIIWAVLSRKSVKTMRIAAASPSLIAMGQYEQAETLIEAAVKGFTLFGGVKLQALHCLALLRHEQRRFGEAVKVSQAILRQRPARRNALATRTRMILAQSLLKMDDPRAAEAALQGLSQQVLTTSEKLDLLPVEVELQARLGDFARMLSGLEQKVQFAELMNAAAAGRTQAFFALACRRAGWGQWEALLKRRAELLCDVALLARERPILQELWPAAAPLPAPPADLPKSADSGARAVDLPQTGI